MQPNYLPLIKIFGFEIRHAVPLFQRPYVWNKEEQWEPLWDDLARLATRVLEAEPNKPVAGHFLGTAVLEQSLNAAGTIGVREIIDGQQRLTTLQILLKATQHALTEMQQSASNANDESAATAARIASQQLLALTLNPAYAKDEEKYKVWPTNDDRPAFRQVMDANSPDELTSVTTRMAEAYRFFLEQVRQWLAPGSVAARSTALAAALKDHLRLIVLDLDNTDEPQAIFETLNAHGTPLLSADLMKNWLLWEATKKQKNVEQLYRSYWQPFDSNADYWRDLVGTGHAARARVDTFLQNWLTRHTREPIAAKHLYDRFLQQVITTSQQNGAGTSTHSDSTSRLWHDVEQLMADICADGHKFQSIEQPTGKSRFDTFLRRLKTMSIVVFHPVLLALMGRPGTDAADLDDAAVALESYLVRRMVCGQQTRGYGALSITLLEALAALPSDGRAAPTIAECLINAAGTAEWPNDQLFCDRWCSRPFYGNLRRDRVLMILQAVEEFYQREGRKGEPIVQFDFSNLQIEHILPQTWEKHWPLAVGDPARANRNYRLNGIGNLTLVSGRLNPSLSNAAWLDSKPNDEIKIDTIRQGKRSALEEHSKLQLNARLVKAYPHVWSESQMDVRALELFETARQIWPRPHGQGTAERELTLG